MKKKGNIELSVLVILEVFLVAVAVFFTILQIGQTTKAKRAKIKATYATGFTAGKAEGKIEAEKKVANEKKGRIYRVIEIKFPENYPRKGYISYITVTGVNVEEKDILIQEVQSSHVYDKTDARFLKQFETAKFVVIGENGELIPLSSYILPQRIGS